jgi:class 3 adenylate cyclase
MELDRMNLPSGTVTFVFSDIVGSTALLKRLGDTEYATLVAVHRRLVRDIFAAHDGQEIDTQGDAFFYSFVRAREAVAAATEVTRAHVKASWPGGVEVQVRLGLHTGEPAVGDEGYTGLDVVRAARIAAVGGGGQVLLSDSTRSIVSGSLPDGVELRALGERLLKDIDRPETLWELVIDGLSQPTPDIPPAETAPDEPSSRARSARRDFGAMIESRVLARLEDSIGKGWPLGSPKPPRRGDVSKEIERLRELREDGALTDDQYRRAVDRLLDEGP